MNKRSHAKLTEGPVGKTLIKLTGPMMIGMIGMVIFNLVDTFFVGRLGTAELAAMGFTFPIVMLQGGISMGLGVGAGAVISRFIGQNDHTMVKERTTDSLLLSVTFVIILSGVGLFTIDPLFSAMGASDKMLVLIREYMVIWYLGVPFVVIPMIGNNAIRAAGNTVIPSLIMLIAIFVNVIFDPLLIFGIGPFPRLGLRGAALATVFARMTTLAFSLFFLHFKFDMLTFKVRSFVHVLQSWWEVLYIGIPAAISQLILPVAMFFITRLVSQYGEEAVAAVSVANRIERFALSPLFALAAVIVPFIGQNLGARKPERIREGLRLSRWFSLGLGLVLFVILSLFGKLIGSIFNDNHRVIEILRLYLLIVSAGYGLQGILYIHASSFNALKLPLFSTVLNALHMFLLYLPIALFLSWYYGKITGIFIGALSSAIIAGGISWVLIRYFVNRMITRPQTS